MNKERLKVNVTFPLSVPVQTDSAGRRRSIPDQVAGYINDFMHDIRIAMLWDNIRIAMLWDNDKEMKFSPGPSEKDIEIFDKINAVDLAERNREVEERSMAFNKAKDKECRELFDVSWNEFRTLNWKDQEAIRELNGVYWDHHKNEWRKK